MLRMHAFIKSAMHTRKVYSNECMNLERHVWILIGKKLAGEATDAEIVELNELAHANPAVRFYFDVMSEWWHIAEQKGQKEASLAFNKHIELMLNEKSPQKSSFVNEMPGFIIPEKINQKHSRKTKLLKKPIQVMKTAWQWLTRTS